MCALTRSAKEYKHGWGTGVMIWFKISYISKLGLAALIQVAVSNDFF